MLYNMRTELERKNSLLERTTDTTHRALDSAKVRDGSQSS